MLAARLSVIFSIARGVSCCSVLLMSLVAGVDSCGGTAPPKRQSSVEHCPVRVLSLPSKTRERLRTRQAPADRSSIAKRLTRSRWKRLALRGWRWWTRRTARMHAPGAFGTSTTSPITSLSATSRGRPGVRLNAATPAILHRLLRVSERRGRTPACDGVSWYDATEACEAAGKRLCWKSEWESACEGPEKLPFPYGLSRDPKSCNIDNPYVRPDLERVYSTRTDVQNAELLRLDQSTASGSMKRCVSGFGVFDLTGNFDEWVNAETPKGKSQWAGLKGGAWGHVRNACRPMTTSHPPEFTYYFISFRCCADAPPSPSVPSGSAPGPFPPPPSHPRPPHTSNRGWTTRERDRTGPKPGTKHLVVHAHRRPPFRRGLRDVPRHLTKPRGRRPSRWSTSLGKLYLHAGPTRARAKRGARATISPGLKRSQFWENTTGAPAPL